ncbi:UNVERIFIED_CONTAM: Kinesin-like protein kif17 [Siphonaria sp. JEL0065]|nr:Kinesin-like protein kif17 [Siphonaria sp. JEL0065]
MPLSRSGSNPSICSLSKLPKLPNKSNAKGLSRSNSAKSIKDESENGVADLKAIALPPSALRNVITPPESPVKPAFPYPNLTPVDQSFPQTIFQRTVSKEPIPDKTSESKTENSLWLQQLLRDELSDASRSLPSESQLIAELSSSDAPHSSSASTGTLSSSMNSSTPSLSYNEQAIKVVVRVRNTDSAGPSILEHNLGLDGLPKTCIKVNRNTIEIEDPTGEAGSKPFCFDSVFGMEAVQETVYGVAVEPLIRKCLEGFNACIFAYGQTAAGKTHTMQGPAARIAETLRDNVTSLHEDIGIILRVVHQLNDHVKTYRGKVDEVTGNCLDFVVKVSYLEIYNEGLVDLLVDKDKQETLKIRMEHGSSNTKDLFVQNLSERYIGTLQDYLKVLNTGAKNRTVGETNMNAQSSRSHAILTITIDQYLVEPRKPQPLGSGLLEKSESSTSLAPEMAVPEEHSPEVLQKIGQGRKRSKIHLIDLAGSERADSTGATGDRLKEGAQINQSLSALGNVISALTGPISKGCKQHIPYRDSKLTYLLSDSLGGNALTLMITCCSPVSKNYGESLSTFRFAERVKKVMNKAVVNMDPFLLR